MDNLKLKDRNTADVEGIKYNDMEENCGLADSNEDALPMQTDVPNLGHIDTPDLLIRNGYQYIKQIGEGSNGKTYKARNKKTGEIVAIKALKFSDNLKNYELFKREAETLRTINVQGVPRYYDFISQGEEFTECWLVQEFIKGKSLLELIESKKKFSEVQVLFVMSKLTRIVHDLQTMYTPPIIHRDIKPSNILIDGDINGHFTLHLIDFGAVANPQKRTGGSTVAGTMGYMAPEQLVGDCTIQSDYYSIGATALHLFTGIAPFEFHSNGFTLQYEDKLKEKVPDIHSQTLALFRTLLAPQPQNRPKDVEDLNELVRNVLMSICKLNINSIKRIKLLNVLFGSDSLIYKFFDGMNSLAILFIFFILIIWGTGFIISYIMYPSIDYFIDDFELAFIFGGSDLIIIIIFLILKKISKKIEAALIECKKIMILSPQVESKLAQTEFTPHVDSSNKVQGKVVAVHSNGIEFVFMYKHRCIAGYQSGTFSYNVGDAVTVAYRRNLILNKFSAWLVTEN